MGCRLWGRTESDRTEATSQQQQQQWGRQCLCSAYDMPDTVLSMVYIRLFNLRIKSLRQGENDASLRFVGGT